MAMLFLMLFELYQGKVLQCYALNLAQVMVLCLILTVGIKIVMCRSCVPNYETKISVAYSFPSLENIYQKSFFPIKKKTCMFCNDANSKFSSDISELDFTELIVATWTSFIQLSNFNVYSILSGNIKSFGVLPYRYWFKRVS